MEVCGSHKHFRFKIPQVISHNPYLPPWLFFDLGFESVQEQWCFKGPQMVGNRNEE